MSPTDTRCPSPAVQQRPRRVSSTTAVPTHRGRHCTAVTARRRQCGPSGERGITVVIEEDDASSTLPLRLRVHGLSPREGEVATLVLHKTSTSVISATLHISEHTVQDHLKAVFDNVASVAAANSSARCSPDLPAGGASPVAPCTPATIVLPNSDDPHIGNDADRRADPCEPWHGHVGWPFRRSVGEVERHLNRAPSRTFTGVLRAK